MRAERLSALLGAFLGTTAGLLVIGCSPPSPGVPSSGPLAEYRTALDSARVAIAVGRALCSTLPAEGERGKCLDQLSALEQGVVLGTETLDAAEKCRKARDEVCLRDTSELVEKRLPELRRLLEGGHP